MRGSRRCRETHTSLAVLSFFRSPNPHRSWITAAGAVLDAAALRHGGARTSPFTARGRAVHPLGLPRAARDRRLLRLRLRRRSRARRSDQRSRARSSTRSTSGSARAGVPVRPGPRPGVARLPGLARQLRRACCSRSRASSWPRTRPWTSDRSSLTPLVRRSPVRRRAQRVLDGGSTVNSHVRNRSTAVIVSSVRIDWKTRTRGARRAARRRRPGCG